MFRFTSLSSVFLAVLFCAPSAFAQAPVKVGVVDFQRALNEVAEGKKAKSTLEQRYEATRLQVESKRAELQQMKENIEAQGVMLSPDALSAKEQEYQREMIAFQQVLMESQQEMALMEQELTGDIVDKLFKTAQKIGAEGGYNIIIEAQTIVYLNGTTDITDEVIARYNNKKK